MKKILLSSFIVIAIVALCGGMLAWFSDTATSGTNSFSAGTLSIDDSKVAESSPITLTNMAPGDVSGEFYVIIENNGTLNLAWLGDWQFDGGNNGSYDLKNALYVNYAKMEFLSPTNTNWAADGTDVFITNGVGSGSWPGWYNTLAAASPFGVVSLNKWNNNAGMVPGSVYEHAGALKPGYKYKLTVKFGLAELAGNGYQGLGPVTAKLKVNATQINTSAIQVYTGTGGWADVTWLNNQITDQIEP